MAAELVEERDALDVLLVQRDFPEARQHAVVVLGPTPQHLLGYCRLRLR